MLGQRLRGKRLGIVGMGGIGQAVAWRARGFGLSIHYHNRRRIPEEVEQQLEDTYWAEPRPDAGAGRHRLGQLPAHAHHLHLPSARRLKLLRPHCIVVNTARGEIIDETALAQAVGEARDRRRGP